MAAGQPATLKFPGLQSPSKTECYRSIEHVVCRTSGVTIIQTDSKQEAGWVGPEQEVEVLPARINVRDSFLYLGFLIHAKKILSFLLQ